MTEKQKLTDGTLVLQYCEGDTSVLPILVKRYHKIFCKKAYWLIKDKELAKDIAQESWIIIINKLHSLENADSFKSWAYRIVYTKAIDKINKRNKERKKLGSLDFIKLDDQTFSDEGKRIQVELLRAIRKLPKGKQDIIRLFYTQEYTINEISSFLKIPVGTVKSRLFKAREKLKSILKNINHEE